MTQTKQFRKPTIIMRAGEALEIIDHLKKMAEVYAALGLLEDAQILGMQVRVLEKRLHIERKP